MRDPFAPPEPVAATAPQLAAALLRTRPTLLEGLGAAAGEAFWRSGIGQIMAEGRLARGLATATEAELTPLSREDWQSGPYAREGVAWDERMTTVRARAIAEIVDENANRRRVLADRDAGAAEQVLQFFAGLGGSLVTPENFIPFAGPMLRAAQAGRLATTSVGRAALGLERATVSSSRAARVAAGGAMGATDAVIGTAITMPLVDASRQRFGDDDTTLAEALMDLSLGAAAGFVLGGAMRLRTPRGATPPAPAQGEALDAVNPRAAPTPAAEPPRAPAGNVEPARAMPTPDADMARGALQAVALGADQLARPGGRVNLAEDPKVPEVLGRMYDDVLARPTGPVDDPRIVIPAQDIERAIIERGAFDKINEVQVSRGGWGLVKLIWRHGERSDEPPARQVSRDDVIAAAEVLRDYVPTRGPSGRTTWAVMRPDETGQMRKVVYGTKTFEEDQQARVVTIYIETPDEVARIGRDAVPLSERAGDEASHSRVRPRDTQPEIPNPPAGPRSPAGGDIAPRPLDFTSPTDQPPRPVPAPPSGRAGDLGAHPEQVEADARLADILAARGDLPEDLRAALAASAEVEAAARDLRGAFDTAAACALGRI
jgi:hypothetical protein